MKTLQLTKETEENFQIFSVLVINMKSHKNLKVILMCQLTAKGRHQSLKILLISASHQMHFIACTKPFNFTRKINTKMMKEDTLVLERVS